jgi:hypothetical protein
VTLALIGLGRRGFANLGHAVQIPGFQIAAFCDLQPPALVRAQAQAKALGLPYTPVHRDFDEILADQAIDAVCLAVPGHWQPKLTILACQAGKDVYVEPPVFGELDEGPPIIDAARNYGRVVQAGTALRSGGAFQRARETVRSGELGSIVFCRATGARDPMPLIDIVQFLFDEAEPVSLDAQPGLGSVDITVRYPGFIASYQNTPGPWSVWLHGTRATLAVTCGDPHHVAHWRNFLECIRTRRRPAGDIETCVRSTEACLRARLAARHSWIAA